MYQKYKIILYDINQRTFVGSSKIDQGLQVYFVHYNGYVFGTSYPKLIVIRERECLINNRNTQRSILDEDQDDEQVKE